MKNNHYILLLLLGILSSCSNTDQPVGLFRSYNVGICCCEIESIEFREGKTTIWNEFGLRQEFKTRILGDRVIFEKEALGKSFIVNFEQINHDSILLFDDVLFVRTEDNISENYANYELYGLNSSQLTSANEMQYIIHYYLDKGNKPVLKLGDNIRPLQDIFGYLTPPHGADFRRKPPKVLLFLGKGVSLRDLVMLYDYLNVSGNRHINIVTGINDLTTFYTIPDLINFWSDELLDLRHELNVPPMPTITDRLKRDFLSDGGIEMAISSMQELEEYANINRVSDLLLVIDKNMEIEEYLKIVRYINKRKKNVRNNYLIEFKKDET